MVWLLLLSEVLYSPSEQNDLLLWPLGLFLPLLPGLRAGKTPHVVHQLEKRHNTKQINPHNLFFWAYILYTHLGFAWVWFLRNRAFGPNTIPAVHGGVEAWTIPEATSHHHSEQAHKQCDLLVSESNGVTDTESCKSYNLWPTKSCAPTGTCTTKPTWSVAFWALTHLRQPKSQILQN